MEEDIKILEQALLGELYGHNTVIVNKKSLENLIKGYREQEELLHRFKESYQKGELKFNSIPKSKIKEKITEIGKEYAEDEIECETYSFMKEILQELMEGK